MKKNYSKYGTSVTKEHSPPLKVSAREGKLFKRLGKTGENESNLLDWVKSWKQYKMGEYPPELLQSLKDFRRIKYDLNLLVANLKYEPELSINKDGWSPTVTERAALATLEGDSKVFYERELFAEWVKTRLVENAAIN